MGGWVRQEGGARGEDEGVGVRVTPEQPAEGEMRVPVSEPQEHCPCPLSPVPPEDPLPHRQSPVFLI